jgi:D-alanyl-D-alanine carboxypeptidase
MRNLASKTPARTIVRRIRLAIFAAPVLVGAVLNGLAVAPIGMLPGDLKAAVIGIDSAQPTTEGPGQHDGRDRPDRRTPAALGEADGVVPDGVTVFDDEIPGVAKLDPGLLKALRRAATDAADDGVQFIVNSGWRSPEYQDQLFREAVKEYGSEAEAARWVAPADRSAHVSGGAVDIGPADAAAWLSEHGADYGLCQIYGNESWHYELRPEAINDGCPPMYADATYDPRMQP